MERSFSRTNDGPSIEAYIKIWKEANPKFWNFGVWTGLIGEALKWRDLLPFDQFK